MELEFKVLYDKIIIFSDYLSFVGSVSAAFIAAEYVYSYVIEVCRRVFQFEQFLEEKFKGCLEMLSVNIETLNNLQPTSIDGKSTTHLIEALKVKCQKKQKELLTSTEDLRESITVECQVVSMSAICLFIFFQSVLFLFGTALGYVNPKETMLIIVPYSILSLIYYVFVWFLGEKNIASKVDKTCLAFLKPILSLHTLKHPTVSIILIVLVSIVLYALFRDNEAFILLSQKYAYFVFVMWSLCPPLSYMGYLWKIRSRALSLKKKITEIADKERIECEKNRKGV